MSVQVVTDSTCDIPAELVRQFGITVVPLTVAYADKEVEDRADFDFAELYARLERGDQPRFIAPSVADFERIYTQLDRIEPILSIHLSSKLSDTCNIALEARTKLTKAYRISVHDSMTTSMALGMMVLAAAESSAAGESLDQIERRLGVMHNQVHLLMAAESSTYIATDLITIGPTQPLRSQINQAQAVRPMVRLENGLFQIQERVRTHLKGLERLYEYVEIFPYIEQMAIISTAGSDEVEALLKRIEPLYKRDQIMLTRCNPLLAAQVGPGMVGIVVNEGEGW